MAIATQEIKPSRKRAMETSNNAELIRNKRINPDILMVIVGAVLIGLAITGGTLLR